MAKSSGKSKKLDAIASEIAKIRRALKRIVAAQEALADDLAKLAGTRNAASKHKIKTDRERSAKRSARPAGAKNAPASRAEPRRRPVLVPLDGADQQVTKTG